jgi:FSR family fosmidomycin resistance protein-like MFS transporter
MSKCKAPSPIAITYGIIHALIDAISAIVIYSSFFVHNCSTSTTFYLILIYNGLAFAGQPLVGILTDKLICYRQTMFIAIGFTSIGLIFISIDPVLATIFVGIGNASFHVGAGALCLFVKPGRATPPGLFVAPGALGLWAGLWLRENGYMMIWLFYLLLFIGLIVSLLNKSPKIHTYKIPTEINFTGSKSIILLLLFSITIRSYVGFAGYSDGPRLPIITFLFALVAFGGKGLGGIISDRVGWIKTSVWALLFSAPLIAFNGGQPAIAIIGFFTFQMTMPVTLVAVVSMIPGKPGFAFGLTCLALFIGSIPTFYRLPEIFYNPILIFSFILMAAGAIYMALSRLRGVIPMKFPIK